MMCVVGGHTCVCGVVIGVWGWSYVWGGGHRCAGVAIGVGGWPYVWRGVIGVCVGGA